MSDLGQLSRSEGAPMTSGPPQLTDILRVRRQSQRCQERTFFPQRSLARAFLRETHPRTGRLGSSGNPKDAIELRWLLRMRGERPRHRAADKRKEISRRFNEN